MINENLFKRKCKQLNLEENRAKEVFLKYNNSYKRRNIILSILLVMLAIMSLYALSITIIEKENLVNMYCSICLNNETYDNDENREDLDFKNEEIFDIFENRKEIIKELKNKPESALTGAEKEILENDPFDKDDDVFWAEIELKFAEKNVIKEPLSYNQRGDLINLYKIKDKKLSLFNVLLNKSILIKQPTIAYLIALIGIIFLVSITNMLVFAIPLLNKNKTISSFLTLYKSLEVTVKRQKKSLISSIIVLLFLGGIFGAVLFYAFNYISFASGVKTYFLIQIVTFLIVIGIMTISSYLFNKKLLKEKTK